MKYLISSILILVFICGCSSVRKVPMITQEEDQVLLELSKSRNDKNNKDRVVIGIVYDKDEVRQGYAEQLKIYFEMTDYVKEVGYSHELSNRPDFIIQYIEPYEKTRIPKMVTIPFYVLSIGVIPMYTYLDWGYNFTLMSTKANKEYPVSIGCCTYGFSGWLCLLINWLPGFSAYHINGEYKPLETDCRLILQLQDRKKDIIKLRSE